MIQMIPSQFNRAPQQHRQLAVSKVPWSHFSCVCHWLLVLINVFICPLRTAFTSSPHHCWFMTSRCPCCRKLDEFGKPSNSSRRSLNHPLNWRTTKRKQTADGAQPDADTDIEDKDFGDSLTESGSNGSDDGLDSDDLEIGNEEVCHIHTWFRYTHCNLTI